MTNAQEDVCQSRDGLLLGGLDGTNPLGFLAALGTLQTLTEVDRTKTVTLAWESHDCRWVPVVRGIGGEKSAIADVIARQMNCPFRPDQKKDEKRERRQKVHDDVKKRLKDAIDSLKNRKLRGNERAEAEKKELDPIRATL